MTTEPEIKEDSTEDSEPEDPATTKPTDGEYVYDHEEHIAQQEAESNSMWEERKKQKAARKAAEEDEQKSKGCSITERSE